MWPFKYPYTNFHEINLDWLLGTVKSNTDRITENELKIKLIGGDDPLNSLHPVGSIFISTENTSPASLFGGTWEQLEDRFLLGASGSYAAGSTGGETAHNLTIDEIPKHRHNGVRVAQNYLTAWAQENAGSSNGFELNSLLKSGLEDNLNKFSGDYSGGDQPHNNMPPYLAVYMWKRVS